jgi:hypothetical protein
MAELRKNPMDTGSDLNTAGAIIYGVFAGSALWGVLLWVTWDIWTAMLCWR